VKRTPPLACIGLPAAALLCGCAALPGGSWDAPDRPDGPQPGPTLLGYSATPAFRRDVKSIHIELLGSRDFRRFWEFRITEAIAKRVELETGWRLAPAAGADTILTGELLKTASSTLAEEPDTGEIREQQFGHQIRWTWKDRRTGRILVERRTEFAYAYAFPELNESASQALDAAVDVLARRVVNGLKADF
jgi:hypothetical protein